MTARGFTPPDPVGYFGKEEVMAAARFFEAQDGARLAYRDEGEGLPLLALSGLTRTMADFDYLKPHLPGGVRLIRMDYRGRGDSAHTGAATYTVAQEGRDALALLDHLGVERAAILGTSRGGLIGMVLGVVARPRLIGLCLNDVGPELERKGLEAIFDYVGRNPAAATHEEAAARMEKALTAFEGVPGARWLAEARLHYRAEAGGLRITYDPALREAFLAAFEGETPDLWPLWGKLAGLPLCLIRGGNSDLLSRDNARRMVAAHPGMIFAEVPGRGHIPFLDEAEAVAAIRAWLAACGAAAA